MVLAVATRALAAGRPAARLVGVARVGAGTQAAQLATSPADRKASRPVSPHVLIYAWPLAAISSITTRVTGGLLTVGLYGIGYGALVGADMPAVMASLGASGIGPLVKASVTFPLAYHFIAAGRHLYWEKNPDGLNPDSQKNSSIGIYAAACGITFVSMLV